MDASAADAQLAHAAVGGDMAAFGVLVCRHQDRVRRVALRITGNPEDALDVTQDTMLAAWINLPEFRGEAAIGTWLTTIVTRKALNLVRSAEHLRRANTPVPDTPDPHRLSDQQTIHRAELDALHTAVGQLPTPQRPVVELHHLRQLSYATVATELGSSEDSVRNHLHRARRALAGRLQAWT